jgi:hypothetical protein
MKPEDRWHSFECFNHPESSTGLVFEVRVEVVGNRATLTSAICPVCSSRCEVRGSWPASENGYGSSGSPQGFLQDIASNSKRIADSLEGLDHEAVTELIHRLRSES